MKIPRFVVAAPGSGHGKTTIATGLMGALVAEGLEVAPFKIGPDYIDPGYHSLATGRVGRNLDPHLCGPELMRPLLAHGMITPSPADVAVVEGVMGLFDGHIGRDGFASTAHVAGLIDAPVVLVVDVSHASRTVAAVVHGLTTFDPTVRVAGVILNKIASTRHEAEVRSAMEATGVPVLGALPRDAGVTAPSRHLGLVPTAERPEAADSVAHLVAEIAARVDLSAVMAIAHGAPALADEPWDPSAVISAPGTDPAHRPVIAVAGGRAFSFRYAETDELLRAAGCDPVIFDPTTDAALPAGTAGLYLGGGFPEVHAAELSGNATMISSLRTAIAAGTPTVAECAGLLYLCRTVDGVPMVGAVDADATMSPKLTLRYHSAVAAHDQLLGHEGLRVTGHEFHRTVTDPPHGDRPAWLADGARQGFATDTLHASYLHTHWAGHPRLAQSFTDAVHAFAVARETTAPFETSRTLAGSDAELLRTRNPPALAEAIPQRAKKAETFPPSPEEAGALAEAVSKGTEVTEPLTETVLPPETTAPFETSRTLASSDAELLRTRKSPGALTEAIPPSPEEAGALAEAVSKDTEVTEPLAEAVSKGAEHDLLHHGDRDVEEGLVDLAVNVRVPRPPAWLADVIAATVDDLGAYPDPAIATAAIAAAHGVPVECVLPTAGGAEAFTLIARALRPAHAVVVHPQFTEPEAALRAAGTVPERLLLDAAHGFTFDPGRVDPRADLIMIGNPTNPTSVLHPARVIRTLVRPGRTVVVDEAFMDAVPGKPESMITRGDLDGLLVLRSLTKTWGLAGLRAGYAVGDPELITALRAQQPPWSVSTMALAATVACLGEDARVIAAAAAVELDERRRFLVQELAGLGLAVVADPRAPFVLVDTTPWAGRSAPGSVRAALRDHGFAVRRGETFPGLHPDWIRLAVRDESTTRSLKKALRVIVDQRGHR